MKANILILDDDQNIRVFLGRLLEKKGFTFSEAASAEEARELVKKQPFELVLCDINLPGESGLDFARFALSEYLHLAAIMITGQDDPESTKNAIDIGAFDYITKPFEQQRILFSVANALKRRELSLANHAYREELEKMVSKRTVKLQEINTKLRNEVSERINSQKVLQKSEQKYRLLINSIPGFVYKGYKDWSVDFINNKFGELTGYDKELFDDRTLKWSGIISNEDRENATQVVKRALKKDNAYVREFKIKTKAGKILFLQDRGQVVHNENNKIEYFSGIFFDITEQKLAQERIRQQEHYYRSILKNMHDNILVVDKNYQVTDVNDTFLSVHNLSRKETLGRKCYDVIHGYDEPCHRYGTDCKLKEVFKTGEPRQRLHKFSLKDGSSLWMDINVSPLKDEKNKVTHIIESARDVTEQKKIEEALWQSEEKYRLLVNNAGDAILIAQDEKIKFSNPKTQEITGYSFEEQVKVPMADFVHPEDRDLVLEAYTRRLKGHNPFDMFPFRIIHKSGKEFWVQVNATSITWEGRPAALTFLRDISELKQAEEEKKRIEAQLLQSEKMASIGQLAAGVAHEINNPTGFVSSNLKTLFDYIKDISNLSKEYRKLVAKLKQGSDNAGVFGISDQLKHIAALEEEADMDFVLKDIIELIEESKGGIERIKKIVRDLKDFAHPGEDKPKFANINENMDSTVNVVWNELKYKAAVAKDYGDLPQVQCYPQLLNQVFMNLLVNAAQSIKEHGEIKIKTQANNGYVEIKVSDTGSGIPEKNLPKIFDPFFTTKEVGKGTGLGLNVAYNIIEKHHGKIDVTSTVGKGTTFTVRIPVAGVQSQTSNDKRLHE
ncbi:MAG: PAS domain S-box protein [Desulfobacterales bacterium]